MGPTTESTSTTLDPHLRWIVSQLEHITALIAEGDWNLAEEVGSCLVYLRDYLVRDP